METIERDPVPGGEKLDQAPDPTLAAELTPTIERGRNLTVMMPPEAEYASPTLAALGSRISGDGVRILILASQAMLESVGRTAARRLGGAGPVHVARSTPRAAGLIRSGQVTTLVATPETALDLVTRSALPLPEMSAVLLAWPETWPDEAPLVLVMQDVPADCQRVLYTSTADVAARLGERYLHKALTLGAPPIPQAGSHAHPRPVGGLTAVATAADRRGAAVAQVLDRLDSDDAVVWSATESAAAAMRQALDGRAGGATVIQGNVPSADLIVAAELPTPESLILLVEASKRLVVMTPTWGLAYLQAHAGVVDTLRIPGAIEAANQTLQGERHSIEAKLEAWGPTEDRALYALGPLFERNDPAQVAAVLYELWTASQAPTLASARTSQPAEARPPGRARPPERGSATNTVKIFVNAGKKDQATPADFVAVLTKEIKVPRQDIGRIELRDTFSLIELPGKDAHRIAGALTGKTIRRRDLVARLERPRG